MLTTVVLAKSPRPGRVKTRLCPPCTHDEAALLAAAALGDTLAAVAATSADRRMLALDGPIGDWLPDGYDVVAQVGGGLDERLAAAASTVAGPFVLIGMDTPQVTPDTLRSAARSLAEPGIDAVLGPASDGGFWAVGLRVPDPRAFLGVPMSIGTTGRAQLARLRELELHTALLPTMRDVDTFEDACAVATDAPTSRFAAAMDQVAIAAR